MDLQEKNKVSQDSNGLSRLIKHYMKVEGQMEIQDRIEFQRIAGSNSALFPVPRRPAHTRISKDYLALLQTRESGGQHWTKVTPSKSTTTGSQAANFPSQPGATRELWDEIQESGSSSSTDSEQDHIEDTTKLNRSIPSPMKTGSWWKFGTARHVSHFSSVQSEAGFIVPFSDKLKLAVEAYVGSKVLWWPLKSISSRPKPSEDQVLWKCVSIVRAPDGTFFAHETTVLRRSLQSFCSLSFQPRGY
jgi:hypothetical protein